jgi:hypothetical protein
LYKKKKKRLAPFKLTFFDNLITTIEKKWVKEKEQEKKEKSNRQ